MTDRKARIWPYCALGRSWLSPNIAAHAALGKVPLGRTKLDLDVRAGRVKVVKAGAATLITTSPAEYLAALRDERAA